MALGFAQATGQPGVYACVPGPGFLNTTAALSTAYACHAPVLALLGQVATEEIGVGHGVLHELPDQTAIVRWLTRWNGLALSAETRRAWSRAPSHPLPLAEDPRRWNCRRMSFARAFTPADAHEIESLEPQRVDPGAIAEAVRLLEGADRPMIMVGAGAIDAGADFCDR